MSRAVPPRMTVEPHVLAHVVEHLGPLGFTVALMPQYELVHTVGLAGAAVPGGEAGARLPELVLHPVEQAAWAAGQEWLTRAALGCVVGTVDPETNTVTVLDRRGGGHDVPVRDHDPVDGVPALPLLTSLYPRGLRVRWVDLSAAGLSAGMLVGSQVGS